MGSASRVTPGRPHNDSPVASLPIENSPPGIHTIPSGAGAGAGLLFGMVGAKGDAAAVSSLFRLAEGDSEGGDEPDLTNAKTPAAETIAPTLHHIVLDREAAGRFCDWEGFFKVDSCLWLQDSCSRRFDQGHLLYRDLCRGGRGWVAAARRRRSILFAGFLARLGSPLPTIRPPRYMHWNFLFTMSLAALNRPSLRKPE